MMHGGEKSDGPIVPAKRPNNATKVVAEAVEERGPAKGNTDQQNASSPDSPCYQRLRRGLQPRCRSLLMEKGIRASGTT